MATKKRCFHKFLVLNSLIGLVVMAVAIYFIVTGEYTNLAERQSMEGMLNVMAFGGLMYAVLAWYGDLYFRPQCRKLEES